MSACCSTDKLNQRAMDELLEKRIEQERIAMTVADDPMAARAHFEEMRNLCAQRSRERIAEMEARLPEPWRS